MALWLRLALGVVPLVGGGALVVWNGWAIFVALTQTRSGVPLLNLAGCIAGLFGIGAAGDCFGWPRARQAVKPKENIAKSIWATAAHVDEYGIGES